MDSTPEDLPTGGSEQISGNTDETSDYIFNDGLRQRWRLKKQEKKDVTKERETSIKLTLGQAKEALQAVRTRAAGWQAGSASLVALILASLVFKSDTAWMTKFSGWPLYLLTGLVALALICAVASMWFVLRAAHGPFSLDAKVSDYRLPHDAKRMITRAKTAAHELKIGQVWLLTGVLLLAISMFGTWLVDPDPEAFRWR